MEHLELLKLSLFEDLRKLRSHLDPVIFGYFNNLGKLTFQLAIIRLAGVDQDTVVEIARQEHRIAPDDQAFCTKSMSVIGSKRVPMAQST